MTQQTENYDDGKRLPRSAESDQKFLFEIAEKIRRAESAEDLLFVVAETIGEQMRARRCFFNEIDIDRDRETVHRDYCRAVESVAGVHPISDYSSITTAEMRAGKTVVNRDSKIDARTAALFDKTYAPAGERAYIAVPLLRENQWVASLWLSDDEPRDWNGAEINLLETIAERAWLAVEKLRSESALRESEARYRALVEATATTVWHATPDGALSFVGDVWTEVSGQSVEEILKWGWLEAIHPEDRERTIEVWQTALAGKTLYATEFRILTAAGEYRWFAASAVPIFDADDNIQEWVGTNIDITERKESESLVRASEEKFSTLAEVVPQLVWMAEPDGFIFWYNRNWYEYTGTTPEDMKGWGWQSVHDAKLLPQVMERWQASIKTGERFEMEFPLRRADGKFRWFLTRVNPLRDANGQIIRWFGTNTDIDEQRKLDLRNRFIIELDEAVRPLETPEEITRALARLLGEHLDADRCAYAEVEADEDRFFIPGDYTKGDTFSIVGHYKMADFGAEVLRLMRANLVYVVDDINTDSQVTEADLAAYRTTDIQAVICVPLHKNNRFSACMAVHQKTPRHWTPEEIELVTFVANRFWESIERARIIKSLHESFAREQEARQSAEQANRLKDEFLATLSHELRTPLNAILGWSQVLQSRSVDESETKKALATIERSARAQNQLIEDLLDVSRITTGKIRLDVRAVDLSNVITAAVDAARPAAEAKNIRLQTLLDPQAGPISGDPDRLQQVVWNLLSNAMKFTPKDGRVQIRLERINSHVEIVISDTGRGIEAEFLPFVFDRFRQSDGSMTRRHGGLGLGLSIARQLIELHGGSVSVASAGEGRGATFTVSLPLLPVRAEAESDSARAHPTAVRETSASPGEGCEPELSGLRVLLVDDETDSRELLNTSLASCGALVTTAGSAGEAFETIRREPFDIILSDIGMPEEDGFSLIAKIRELPDEQGGKIPAIALTAYARSEDRIQALRSGFQMHIAKPVEPSELIAVVANLTGRIGNS